MLINMGKFVYKPNTIMMLSRCELSLQVSWKFFWLCDGAAPTKCCFCPSPLWMQKDRKFPASHQVVALVAFQGRIRTKMTPPAMISEAFIGSCSSTVLKLPLNPIALIRKMQWRCSCSGSNHHLFSGCVVGCVLMLPHAPSAVTNQKNKRL